MNDTAAAILAGTLEVAVRQERPIPLDAAFRCAPGELTVLVGPSGSGKTTLLRVIAGLHRPAAGRIAVGGETWFDAAAGVHLPPQRRSAGLVFQHYALFPHMSALDNVMAAMGHRPPGERLARARELLARVHLSGLEARRPAQLSGGQQQRVAVARALARDPAVLLLDEPFSAVDQVTRGKLQRELAQLRRELRLPIVLVTHDLSEARALADRICLLNRGRTLQEGSPEDVLARPASALAARLVGLSNLFDGTVLEHRDTVTLIAWRGLTLEARRAPAYAPGQMVSWVIPAESVILHRRDRPSRGERENPVDAVVSECVELGETTSLTLRAGPAPGAPLALSIPTHVAHRNGVVAGAPVRVSLLAEALHLMPWDAPGADEERYG